ncbi:MAG: RNA methyltransferase [Thermonema sp.]|nr:MAG: RNA methyltransferase [Thermonema sp.]
MLTFAKGKQNYPVKLHRNLIEGIIEVLQKVFQEHAYSDKAIESVFKQNKRWGARDRAFVAEHSYNLIRNHKRLRYALGMPTEDGAQEQHTDALRRLAAGYFLLLLKELPSWDLFTDIPAYTQLQERYDRPPHPSIAYSVSDWLWQYGTRQMGEGWQRELAAMHTQADVYLRVNTLKTDIHGLRERLLQEGFATEPVEEVPSALRLTERGNIFRTKAFQEGLFEVQDAGSQLIAPFLEVKAGMRVIDACAGAGGKTLHLATLMRNKGHIIAMDVEEWKLKELRKRARRNEVFNIETRLIDNQTIKRLRGSADRLLLDVPCTGSGVLRRNPDAKWRITQTFADEVKAKQQKILELYPQMLKTGGKMVYATCSVFPEENRRQIEHFLALNPHFELEAEELLLPSYHGWDGFYMARLRKTAP